MQALAQSHLTKGYKLSSESSYLTEIVSGLGAIGSVVGALFAWLQHHKAKNSAENASTIEGRLMEIMKQKELIKEVEKIKAIVRKLGRYVRRGQNLNKQGLSLEDDLAELTEFRNEFKASFKHSKQFETELDEIFNTIKQTDFNDTSEFERIEAISSIIENLNTIA
ncbi:hypothetical protein, partial [Aliivibrio salmonicida]|uniref:hypothetical protein n=1 Tax=Aliivibrio salmonicida TaxID=40269 RepID=UPI003D11352C